MWRPTALHMALNLVEHPTTVRQASRSPLPDGVTHLLQVAAGDDDALRDAQAKTRRPQADLQTAAGFFIEQILFSQQADYYRILGTSATAPRSELRRNMALLIKWLHPDGHEQRVAASDLDRGIFIHRVTQAWENLKTDERRAAYDRVLAEKARPAQPQRPKHPQQPQPEPSPRARAPEPPPKAKKEPSRPFADHNTAARKAGPRRLVIDRFERDSFFNRLLLYLQGRP